MRREFLLFIVALVTALCIGYGCDLSAHRQLFSTAMPLILIMLVVTVIRDLDGPRRGWIRESQNSMVRLRQSLSTYAPPAGSVFGGRS